ncbi:vWA domain-containing protein [uncultured Microscilla sp.]|uniref:vWA domain-containing protein n=1 Tax=uncultured Microscilla sp. TaxID=432653 RepID=UPI002636DAE3|nr:vWA domain-containing protein [uncultured Microscilla sp.]
MDKQTINQLMKQVVQDQIPLSENSHNTLLEHNRMLYASLLNLPGLSVEDSMQIIQRLLAVTEQGGKPVSLDAKKTEDRLMSEVLPFLEAAKVLEGFGKLVKLKVNNQRTASWIKNYILGSPDLEQWAVSHRALLAKLLGHALGKQVAQTCVHFMLLGKTKRNDRQNAYLDKYIYRCVGNNTPALVKEVYLFLFGKLRETSHEKLNAYLQSRKKLENGKGLPYKVLRGLAATFHPKTEASQVKRLAGKNKVKREYIVGGELVEANSTNLVDRIRKQYIEGRQDEWVTQKILAEASKIPHWDAKVALVLDASYSMLGFGARMYNNLSIATALTQVLEKRTSELTIVQVGNQQTTDFPQAQGVTTLAEGILEAMEHQPDVVLVISDGYENVEQGDAEMVLRGLKNLGVETPFVHILPAFTVREAYEHRQALGKDTPLILETGEKGLMPTWLNIQFALQPDRIADVLQNSMQMFLN